MGLVPSPKPKALSQSGNHVEPSPIVVCPTTRSEVIKAPPWLVERMEAIRKLPPPTEEEVRVQMESSAKLRRQLDRGLTQEEAKQFALDHSQDILAHLNAPWREKIGENRYQGSCGCVFDAEGNRVEWCGDHY
jgi:hypothetical protein